MQWLATPSGKRGCSQTFSDAAIQFFLSIKCLFGQALRQTLGLAQLGWPVPDYSTVYRRQQTLQAQLNYRPNAEPLQLLVDSTGVKFLGEGEWKRKKHGAEYCREWRKVHLSIDAQTLEIRAVEVTAMRLSTCRDAIAQRGTVAVIAQRKNARLWNRSTSGSGSRNEAVRACQRLRHGIWKMWSSYHRRSLVETNIHCHCLKRLGERVTARTFERQVVELHVRVAVLNRFSQIGRPQTVLVVAVA